MRRLGLASKIALPFVLLFAVLLVGLGIALTREIFNEVELAAERKLRFVLSVAAHKDMPLHESFLSRIRDQARWEEDERAEFVVFDERCVSIWTTLLPASDVREPIVKGLRKAIADKVFPDLSGPKGPDDRAPSVEDLRKAITDKALPESRGPKMSSQNLRLGGRSYLVLYATRFPNKERFFLLYPREGIEAAKQRALERIALFGALGLLLAAVLARLVAGWISRPVRRLAATADRLAAGGLNEPLEEDLEGARDEIGRLAAAFRQMVESLRRSQEKLVKHERLVATGKLAATVAHEIRNPLTSLRMTVQMLSQKPCDEATAKAYTVVLGEIDRLALTVEELLTFARPRAPQREPVDLNQIVRNTVAFLERQFEHARVEPVLACDESLPQMSLDPNKIRQLLYNLLLNGLQAIVRNGRVTVRTQWDAQRRAARLEVADTGPGISDELRSRVFDAFVSSKPGGGGLGLAIAKQIVEEHDGTIGFQSSKDGAVFYADLPAK